MPFARWIVETVIRRSVAASTSWAWEPGGALEGADEGRALVLVLEGPARISCLTAEPDQPRSGRRHGMRFRGILKAVPRGVDLATSEWLSVGRSGEAAASDLSPGG